jgi:hypothetical protein
MKNLWITLFIIILNQLNAQDYSSLIPVLTKAIQEQQQQLEAQQKLTQSLLERLETLENK